ncbi:beta strand repeat-containing protein [Xylanibacter ruminicola]|nr:CUB domain-containing protein [Xylanibacter ruminicola]
MNRFVKNAHPTVHKGRLLLTLLFMLVTAVTTWADNVTLTPSTSTTWTNGNTYVTNGDVTIADRITVEGDVTLILTDGYTLTAPNGIEVRVGNSLTIQGGTNGTGKLTIEKNGISRAGIGGGFKKVGIKKYPTQYGNITINGGIVNVKGGAQSAGIGGDSNSELDGNGTITINGGIVNATGGNKAAGIGGGNCSYDNGAYGGCGKIVINGGQVTATGGENAPGIGPGNGAADKTSGSLVLGWAKTLDFIQVTGGNSSGAYGFSNRLGSISFADGKKFNIVGVGEATTENIKKKVSLTLVPKGSEQNQLSAATISGISASYDLTGSYLDIPFSVSDAEGHTLTLGTDYTATLGTTSQESTTIHITEGGKYTLTINGKGSYTGSKSIAFEVISIGFKKDANGVDYINMPKTGIENATIPEGVSSFKVYDDGGAKAKYSNSYDGGLVLTAPDHYVLQLTGTVTAEVQVNNPLDYLMVYDGGSTSAQKIGDKYGSESGENIGTLISSGTQMTLTFHSDVSGQRDGLDLTVTLKRDLGSCVIADIDDQPYTGSAIEPDLVITYEGTALVKDVDYEVTYSNNTIVGTATITITGKGNYAGTTSKTFTIVKATPTVTAPAAVENLIYTGGSLNLVAAGTTDFGTLLYSTDGNNYSADIPTETNAGTYTVYYKVAGDANHNDVSGSIEVTITQKAVTNDGITVTIPSQTWTGSGLTPVITVKDGETELIKNTDYTVTAPSGTIQDAGDYTYTISGVGNYSGEKAATFTISPKAVTNDGITIAAIADKTYTGSAIEPGVTVNDGEKTLTLGTDYTIGYSANVNVGTATATITGKGNYSGEKAATFTIIPKAVTNDGITIAAIDVQTYTGSAIEPEVTVTDGEKNLTLGTDYEVAYSNNISAGTATVTITGQGNYKGETTATFTIAQKAVTSDDITIDIPSQTWTGSEITFDEKAVVVKDGEKTLEQATDYIVTAPTDKLQNTGDYTVTINGAGNYAGSITAKFTIVPKVTTYGALTTSEDQIGKIATIDGTSIGTVEITDNPVVEAITLNRKFSKDKASTIMLPFDYTCDKADGGVFYDFVDVKKDEQTKNNQWVATMTKVDKLTANTPYLFMPADDINGITFTLSEKVTLNTTKGGECQKADKGSNWTFKGTYSYIKWTSDTKDNDYTQERSDEIGKVYGFAGVAKTGINVGDFVKVKSGAKIRPMTCYLLWSNTPNASKTRGASDEELPSSIVVRLLSNVGPGNQDDDDNQGGTTAIGTLDTETGEIDFSGWYDMSGHKLSGKPTKKGIYINNGKKVVIKN